MPYQHDWRSKVVMDPICKLIDIGPVQPVVDTPEFQLMRDKRQLSLTYLVFPAAVHMRFSHSLGAYFRTVLLANEWRRRRYIDRETRDAMVMYALLHDVGHAAFSHATEGFLDEGHDSMTAHLIHGPLRSAIESCDVNADLVLAMARHEDPRYLGVHDKNLGVEKLDYLERDAHYTIMGAPDMAYLQNYIYYLQGSLVIDEKVVEQALDVQQFYMKMFKRVYFRKANVIAQRMFHKAVDHCILAGELAGNDLVSMTDSELLGRLSVSREPTTQDMYQRLRMRRLYVEAITIRPEQFDHETRVADKPIQVLGVPQSEMDRIVASAQLQQDNHRELELVEQSIAGLVRMPAEQILVVPVFNPERFKPKDIMIFGSDQELHSARERRPDHFAGLEEIARSYSALRICTDADHRHVLSIPGTAQAVKEIVMSLIA